VSSPALFLGARNLHARLELRCAIALWTLQHASEQKACGFVRHGRWAAKNTISGYMQYATSSQLGMTDVYTRWSWRVIRGITVSNVILAEASTVAGCAYLDAS
jgi:hypothetical protein